MKSYKLKAEDIKPLKKGMGACIATDRITVDGHRVSFMYREYPDNNIDSGWRFFSGVQEDDQYINDPTNSGTYDVNTIANHDPAIIPYLDAPIGSAFERNQESGDFLIVDDFVVLQ